MTDPSHHSWITLYSHLKRSPDFIPMCLLPVCHWPFLSLLLLSTNQKTLPASTSGRRGKCCHSCTGSRRWSLLASSVVYQKTGANDLLKVCGNLTSDLPFSYEEKKFWTLFWNHSQLLPGLLRGSKQVQSSWTKVKIKWPQSTQGCWALRDQWTLTSITECSHICQNANALIFWEWGKRSLFLVGNYSVFNIW
jgi:hypothetical protein